MQEGHNTGRGRHLGSGRIPPMIAPPSTAAPIPQPPPRHCTVSMPDGTAFLITRALAIGIADATSATGMVFIATNTAIAAAGSRFVIGSSPLLCAHPRFPDNPLAALEWNNSYF